MPYIEPKQKQIIDTGVQELIQSTELVNSQFRKSQIDKISEGELNYMITRIVQTWCTHRGVCYATFNAAIGVLSCVLHELYRIVVSPYEDKKIEENGPVGVLDQHRT